MPLHVWRRLEPVQRAEAKAHLRVRSLREKYEMENGRKDAAPATGPADVGLEMMKAMGGLKI